MKRAWRFVAQQCECAYLTVHLKMEHGTFYVMYILAPHFQKAAVGNHVVEQTRGWGQANLSLNLISATH